MDLHRRRRHDSDLVQAKRGTMMTLAAHVAHEVSTPLAAIRMLGASMEDHLPVLIAAYEREVLRGADATIPADVLATIEMAPSSIRSVAERASMLMQLLLVNAGEKSADENDYRPFSMRRCVNDALTSYSFVDGERDLVRLDGEDFILWGSDVLMTFVLYNLLKNSLYAIRAARKGKIFIDMVPGSPNNRLLFRDTGKGIPRELLPRIFEEFFTARGARGATGMGLPFCRRVVNAFGGTIECRSEEGEYTELELSFPIPQGTPADPLGERG
jgi:signal transduction histidine kinase